jgi:hypothetical protein
MLTLAVLLATTGASMSRAASTYHYYGIRQGRLFERLALLNATITDGSHAAVWVGVNSPGNQSWLQGGVLQEQGDTHPWAYIEIGPVGRRYSIQRWPVALGQRVPVRLVRRNGYWRARVTVGDQVHVSRRVRVPHAISDSMLEILGTASAVGMISHRLVVGSTIGSGNVLPGVPLVVRP